MTVGECKMDFPVATRIPSLPARQYHYGGREHTRAIFSHYNPEKIPITNYKCK